MLRAVVDPGVFISALISPSGTPAELVRRWLAGEFQTVWSPALLDEFTEVCSRERFRPWFSVGEAERIAEVIREGGERCEDMTALAPAPPDPDDRYLTDLLVTSGADALVTGDSALLAASPGTGRIVSPRAWLALLDALDQE